MRLSTSTTCSVHQIHKRSQYHVSLYALMPFIIVIQENHQLLYHLLTNHTDTSKISKIYSI